MIGKQRVTSGVSDPLRSFGSHRNHSGENFPHLPDDISTPIAVLAWLHIVLGAASLIAEGFFCIEFLLTPDWLGNFFLAFAIPLFIFLSMALFVPALAGGIGLLRGRTWARVVILLLSLVMLFFFPIGTILGGFGIMALRGDHDTFRPLP